MDERFWPTSEALARVIETNVVHTARVKTGVVYVGRTFAGRVGDGWGNPVSLEQDTDSARARVLVSYFTWLQSNDARARKIRARIRAGELDGAVLSCWCAPKLCHGMILAGLAAGLVPETKAWVAQLAALADVS